MSIVVFLLYFGYQRSQMYLVIVGFAFMFLTGIDVLYSGWSYTIGNNITTINSSFIQVSANYATYTNHTLSWLFVFVAAAGGIVSMMQLKGGNE
jgi:hypothetical protein